MSGLRESTAWIMRSRRIGAHRRPIHDLLQGPRRRPITAAFQEYMGRKLRRETRTSVLERLEQYKDMARNTVEKVRKKVLER